MLLLPLQTALQNLRQISLQRLLVLRFMLQFDEHGMTQALGMARELQLLTCQFLAGPAQALASQIQALGLAIQHALHRVVQPVLHQSQSSQPDFARLRPSSAAAVGGARAGRRKNRRW